MTIKHLPGQHNQKKHGSSRYEKERKLREVENELRRKNREAAELKDLLKQKHLHELVKIKEAEAAEARKKLNESQQRVNSMGIKTPMTLNAVNEVRRKYGSAPSPVVGMPSGSSLVGDLAVTGFTATVVGNNKEGELYTGIEEVDDPVKTGAYINDFIEIARRNQMNSAVFSDLPIDVATNVGGVYKMDWTALATTAAKSLVHLRDTYGFEIPKEFDAGPAKFGRSTRAIVDGVDLQKVADWLGTTPRSGLMLRNDSKKGSQRVVIKVDNFHSVPHPSHPEVPLFTEYMYQSGSIPSVYVDL